MTQDTLTLPVAPREVTGKQNKRLRKQGMVPAVVYGYNTEPTNLTVDAKQFETTYHKAGKTSLVSLQAQNGRTLEVLIHEVQRDPLTRLPQHVDFLAVNLDKALTADVPIVLVGESPAVEANLGVLMHQLDTLAVEALPANLPHQIEVSVVGLTAVDQAIHVGDLQPTSNYRFVTPAEELIVKVIQQQLEPEVEEVPEGAAEEQEAEESAEETAGAGE